MVIIICRNTPLFHTIYSPMQFLLQSRSNLPVGSLVQGYHINRQDKLLQSLRKPKGTRKQLPSVLYTRQEVMILDPMDNVWSQETVTNVCEEPVLQCQNPINWWWIPMISYPSQAQWLSQPQAKDQAIHQIWPVKHHWPQWMLWIWTRTMSRKNGQTYEWKHHNLHRLPSLFTTGVSSFWTVFHWRNTEY